MGYEKQKKVYNLLFADSEFEGLEVQVKSTSMGNILKLAELDSINPLRMSSDDIAKIRQLFDILSGSMVSWNLEEDGAPVGFDVEGLLAQEPEFVMTVIKAWTRAMTQATPDLKSASLDGDPSVVHSIPMETLSESQAS